MIDPKFSYETVRRIMLFQECTVRDAMACLDETAFGIVLLVDAEGRLLGTLTDGDLRRALLGGATLAEKALRFARRDYSAFPESVSRDEVLDLMRAKRIFQVPILDAQRRVVGLHLMHDIVGAVRRPNAAVIMAGGKGSRLLPLTSEVPKPMIKVAGRPILERLVLHLVGHGITRIYISTHHLAERIESHFQNGADFGCQITYLREEAPLGTGGALALLPPEEHSLLVMNGDLVTQVNVGSLLDHHERKALDVTIGARPYCHQIPFGCLDVEDGLVRSITEKPVVDYLVNAGIYVIRPTLLGAIPRGKELPITSFISQKLKEGKRVGLFEIQEDWIDVGEKDQLREARGL